VHLGALRNKPTDSVERARARLTQAAPTAVDTLEELMNSAESEPVKLKAATEILDRSGVRAGFDIGGEVSVDVRPAASIIADRLQRLSVNALEAESRLQRSISEQEGSIIDVEVTEEKTEEVDKNED
jgi:hypothetical protein